MKGVWLASMSEAGPPLSLRPSSEEPPSSLRSSSISTTVQARASVVSRLLTDSGNFPRE
jgi:hypothetical protein